MPKPLTVTSLVLFEVPTPNRPFLGSAEYSDGKARRFSGTVETGFKCLTAPAVSNDSVRWFYSPARDDALRNWFRENDAAKHIGSYLPSARARNARNA